MTGRMTKNKNKSRVIRRGFTLIELLVVISIIGILTAFALTSYTGAQKQSRDSQRKSDINQYRIALEAYASANNDKYPSRAIASGANIENVFTDSDETIYLSSTPLDPVNSGSYVYKYKSDGSGAGGPTATKYVIWGGLETGGIWIVCSNGKLGKVSSFTPSDTCPL